VVDQSTAGEPSRLGVHAWGRTPGGRATGRSRPRFPRRDGTGAPLPQIRFRRWVSGAGENPGEGKPQQWHQRTSPSVRCPSAVFCL